MEQFELFDKNKEVKMPDKKEKSEVDKNKEIAKKINTENYLPGFEKIKKQKYIPPPEYIPPPSKKMYEEYFEKIYGVKPESLERRKKAYEKFMESKKKISEEKSPENPQ